MELELAEVSCSDTKHSIVSCIFLIPCLYDLCYGHLCLDTTLSLTTDNSILERCTDWSILANDLSRLYLPSG